MKLNKIIISILLIINTSNAFSQINDPNAVDDKPRENSPLTRFGLGNLAPRYLINTAGMGGLTAAYRDVFTYNPANPASLPSLRATAYELGLYAKSNSISDGKNQSEGWTGNINHLAVAFPTYSVLNELLDRKPRTIRWAMGFSLTPYNTVGYNANSVSKATNTDSVTITNYYFGSGGSYKMTWGNGVSYKDFSAGINLGYVFGKMSYSRQTVLSSNLLLPFANDFEDDYNLSGFIWNLGVQYAIDLDPKTKTNEKGGNKKLLIGLYGNPATNFSTTSSQFYRRSNGISYGQGNPPATDSISEKTDIEGVGQLPSEFTAGVTYEDGINLKIGVEYSSSKWSSYTNQARPEQLKDASNFAIGAEFILNRSKLKAPEDKVRWRLGFRSGSDPRSLNGEQVTNQAFTAGLSYPLRVGRGQQLSYLNLGLELGKLGTAKYSENYFRITLGFTLNDNSWFLKRKFE